MIPPLTPFDLTPADLTDLEIAARRAVCSGHRADCCRHCGRRLATVRPGADGLCYGCNRAPLDTPYGRDALARLDVHKFLSEQEGI